MVDLAIAVGAGAAEVAGAAVDAHRDSAGPQVTPEAVALLLAGALALIARRRWPFPVALVVGVLSVAYGVADLPDPPLRIAALVSLATVAARCGRRTTLVTLGIVAAVTVVAIVASNDSGVDDYYVTLLPSLGALALGDAYRVREEAAVRNRAAEVGEARAEERGRIARELHDVVAHHVTVMVVRAEAGAAPAEAEGDERAVAAFDGIARTGREALGELRRLLGVLHTDAGRPVQGTEPQPSLDRLPHLVEEVRQAGLPVELSIVGEPRPVANGVDVSAYRIVQEALTNVVRHAGPVPTSVEVEWEPGWLSLAIEDAGGGPMPVDAGRVGA